jgi:polyadenylate-binding protein
MNGSIVGSKPLYVALAQRKEERRMHLTNQHIQRMATSRMPHPQMQLPFPNGMSGMMPYLPTALGASQPRNFFQPTAMPAAYRPQPRWSSATAAGGLRPQSGGAGGFPNQAFTLPNARVRQPNAQMIPGMPMSQSMAAAQRAGAMAGAPSRSAMPMQTRPTPTPGQMIAGASIRPQAGGPTQPQTAYTRTARNMPTSNPSGFGNSIVVPGQEPLTPAALANATPQEQKQMLGERLFPLIQQMQPELAGKITGMLLEIDNTELLHMLESRESLKAKVEEAIAVLQAHQAKQLYAAKQAATNSAAS